VAERIYLSLGSNIGDRESNLRRAFQALSEFCRDLRMSRIYQTVPLYVADQPPFLNAAVEGVTDLEPEELLSRIHEIEAGLGRDRRRERRMGPRAVDIDVLLYGNLVLDSTNLTIPHTRMRERAFVLVPLLELAPGLKDPRTGAPYRDDLSGVAGQGVYSYSPP
jgi:2-amino-4-hydroxy-6-hydroxymethyldihydropteridine diphosphokinase